MDGDDPDEEAGVGGNKDAPYRACTFVFGVVGIDTTLPGVFGFVGQEERGPLVDADFAGGVGCG